MHNHLSKYRDVMRQVLDTATTSDDPSTQVGAAIIHADGQITLGVNNMPPGVLVTPERLERPLKYQVREHAERTAIHTAAKLGRATLGATMLSTWAACSGCSRSIISSGVERFIYYPSNDDHWVEDIIIGRDMMREAGVEVIEHNFPGLAIPALRHNYGLWTPHPSTQLIETHRT